MERCLNCMKEYEKAYGVCPHCGFVKGTPPKEIYHLVPGAVIGKRYEIGTVVGAGGFGVVYRAWDRTLEKMVAIKEYYPATLVSRIPGSNEIYIYAKKREEEYYTGLERFLEEARNMARFSNHSNIVNVYNFFEENNTAYCVMQFLQGISFKEYIKKQGGIVSCDVAVKVASSVLDALHDIHRAGIIHRDIAPDNVIMLEDSGTIVLMDFGAARFSKEEKMTIVLKPGFAPPEQYKSRSKQGAYTDVYAVGAMMYRAVTGIMPEESTNRLKEECLVSPMALNPDIPEKLSNAIIRAMSIQPELRFQTAEEFKEALKNDKKVLNTEQELQRRKKKRGTGLLVAALLLIMGIGIGTSIFLEKRAETVLKPAELLVWVPAESGREERVENIYGALADGFRETYPQIKFVVRAIPVEQYEERLATVVGTDEMPDVYDSSMLTGSLTDAEEIDKVWKYLDFDEYYGLEEYAAEEESLRLPVSFSRPALYVNTVLTSDLDVTELQLENEQDEDRMLDSFLKGELEYLLADTACYTTIQSQMAGRYSMQPVPDGVIKASEFLTYFSMRADATKAERNAAYRFLSYLVSDKAQNILCIQNGYGLPVNRAQYETFVEINSEFEVFSQEAMPDFDN